MLREQVIDGQDMNPHLESLCNTMTVGSYEEVLGRITAAIGDKNESPELWDKIKEPLNNLKQANFQINSEKHTNMMGDNISQPDGMTGDCMADESDTYWSMIQTTLCEQGSEFQ